MNAPTVVLVLSFWALAKNLENLTFRGILRSAFGGTQNDNQSTVLSSLLAIHLRDTPYPAEKERI